jgi:hypothetical protein
MSKTFLDLNTNQTHALLQLVLDAESKNVLPGQGGLLMAYEASELTKVMNIPDKEALKLARQLEAAGYLSSESEAKTKTVKIGKMIRHQPVIRVYYRVTTLGLSAIAALRELLASLEEPVAEAA